MRIILRKHCGNIGGLSHLTGNFCLLVKGLISSMLAGQTFDWSPLLTEWPATLSGLIFLCSASILVFFGHVARGFMISAITTLVGYSILGSDLILTDGPVSSLIGIAVGMISSVYTLMAASRYNWRFISVNTRYLHRRLKQALTKSLEEFPFWPAGAIEFISDTALLAGAIIIGDTVMIVIAGLWTLGSILIGSASPALSPVKARE